MYVDNKRMDHMKRSAETFSKYYAQKVIEEAVNKLTEKTGLNISCDTNYISIGYSSNWLDLRVCNDQLYDFITTHKNGSATPTNLEAYEDQTLVFVVEGVELRITVHYECPLPPEDFELFETMGKVHRSVIPARSETAIMCGLY